MERKWSVGWASVASDGTEWHSGLRQGQLAGHKATQVADLSLHQYDMGFCERLLKEHGARFGVENDDLARSLDGRFDKVRVLLPGFGTGSAYPT